MRDDVALGDAAILAGAGNGGGIHNNSGGTVAVANSTVSGNTATANTGVGDGGGVTEGPAVAVAVGVRVAVGVIVGVGVHPATVVGLSVGAT